MSFDAHGSRRSADGANAWSGLVTNYAAPTTRRGFTGHEHVDSAGIVHMNGRLYDAALGRMLSPDPIVQEPFNAQNLNRYTYVLNNPLSYTDPSGLSFVKKYWRQIASIAINMFLPGAGWFTGIFGQGLANTLVAGFISGVVSSGSLQGGLIGAFSATVFRGIGAGFEGVANANTAFGPPSAALMRNGLTAGQFAAKVLTHGIAGGVMGTLQGGKFGHGFASAGVAQLGAPAIDSIGGSGIGSVGARVAAAAIVGGTASVLSGGKFANGAVTAAFARAYNDESHLRRIFRTIGDAADEFGHAIQLDALDVWDSIGWRVNAVVSGVQDDCSAGALKCVINLTGGYSKGGFISDVASNIERTSIVYDMDKRLLTLAAGGTIANVWGGMTAGRWAFSGFRAAAHLPTRAATARLVVATTVTNTLIVGGYYEAWNTVGSVVRTSVNRAARAAEEWGEQ